MEGVEWNDGVALLGSEVRAVWLTDPDGNILNLSAGELQPPRHVPRLSPTGSANRPHPASIFEQCSVPKHTTRAQPTRPCTPRNA